MSLPGEKNIRTHLKKHRHEEKEPIIPEKVKNHGHQTKPKEKNDIHIPEIKFLCISNQ